MFSAHETVIFYRRQRRERRSWRSATIFVSFVTFCKISAAFLACAGFAAQPASSAPEQEGGFFVGCAAGDFPTLAAAIAHAKAAGIKIVELEYGQPLAADSSDRLDNTLAPNRLEEFKRNLRANGLVAMSLRVLISSNRNEVTLDFARKLGISRITARLSGPPQLFLPKPEKPPTDWKPGLLDRLSSLADDRDLVIGLENSPKTPEAGDLWNPEYLTSLLSNRTMRFGISLQLEEAPGLDWLATLRRIEHRLVNISVPSTNVDRALLTELKRYGFNGTLLLQTPASAANRTELAAAALSVIRTEGPQASTAGVLEAEKDVKVINGFKYEILAQGELAEPMDLEFTPDGRLWVTGRRGEIWVTKPGSGNWQQAAKLAVDYSDDRGLHGIEFHPGFATNGFVFLFYSPVFSDGLGDRLSRFTITESDGAHVDLGSEKILIEFRTGKVGQHNGGAVEYNPFDGKLYVSTGDNNNIPDLQRYYDDPQNRAQSLMDLRGKVLRLNLDGSIPIDNPFSLQPGRRGEIYTYGHRQPYTIRIDATAGEVYIGENGGDRSEDFEEINRLVPGGNYGWPRCIGDNLGTYGGACPITNAVKPWFTYQRFTGASCQVGPWYQPSEGQFAFPPKYENGLFYADYNRKWLRFVKLDARVGTLKSEPFARGFAGGPLAVEQGPDGAIYLVEYGAWMRGSSRDRISRIIHEPNTTASRSQ